MRVRFEIERITSSGAVADRVRIEGVVTDVYKYLACAGIPMLANIEAAGGNYQRDISVLLRNPLIATGSVCLCDNELNIVDNVARVSYEQLQHKVGYADNRPYKYSNPNPDKGIIEKDKCSFDVGKTTLSWLIDDDNEYDISSLYTTNSLSYGRNVVLGEIPTPDEISKFGYNDYDTIAFGIPTNHSIGNTWTGWLPCASSSLRERREGIEPKIGSMLASYSGGNGAYSDGKNNVFINASHKIAHELKVYYSSENIDKYGFAFSPTWLNALGTRDGSAFDSSEQCALGAVSYAVSERNDDVVEQYTERPSSGTAASDSAMSLDKDCCFVKVGDYTFAIYDNPPKIIEYPYNATLSYVTDKELTRIYYDDSDDNIKCVRSDGVILWSSGISEVLDISGLSITRLYGSPITRSGYLIADTSNSRVALLFNASDGSYAGYIVTPPLANKSFLQGIISYRYDNPFDISLNVGAGEIALTCDLNYYYSKANLPETIHKESSDDIRITAVFTM